MNEPVDFGRLQAEKYRLEAEPKMRYRGIFYGLFIAALIWFLVCLIFIVTGHAGNNWDEWQAQHDRQEMLRLQREQTYQQEQILQEMRQREFNENMRRLREDTAPRSPDLRPMNPRWE